MTNLGHNGGPKFAIDPNDAKMFWFKLDIADFKRRIADLDYELRGYLITLLVELYDSKGRLPYDLPLLGKRLGTTARVMKRVLNVLIAQGEIYVAGEFIRSRRCDEEREKFIGDYCQRHASAIQREQAKRELRPASEKVWPKFHESLTRTSAKQFQFHLQNQ